jgi:TetR/AcrR family transcriptional repressor of nem operon
LLASELPTVPAEVAHEVRGHFEDLSQWLASVLSLGAAQGQFQFHGTANTEARSLMATVHGAMLAARAFGDPTAFAEIAHTAISRLIAP